MKSKQNKITTTILLDALTKTKPLLQVKHGNTCFLSWWNAKLYSTQIQAGKPFPYKALLHPLLSAEPDSSEPCDEQRLAEQKSLVLNAQTTQPA